MKGTKAFMSDHKARRKAGPEYIVNPLPFSANQDRYTEDALKEPNLAKLELAIEEARRILAETEPERDQNGDRTAHVPADFPEWGMDAARESVSAFLTAPDPAAYLYATAHVPTLPCGCPLDSGCDSYHRSE